MDPLIGLFACGSSPPAPPPACPEPPAVAARTPFEVQVIGPQLEALRAGVVPAGPEGLGWCAGTAPSCARYLGREPGELPEGPWFLKAELDPPDLGLWQVDFAATCVVMPADGSEPVERTVRRRLEVPHIPGQPTSLTPLIAVSSPSRDGVEECRWVLTVPHPDGAKEITGTYGLPGPG